MVLRGIFNIQTEEKGISSVDSPDSSLYCRLIGTEEKSTRVFFRRFTLILLYRSVTQTLIDTHTYVLAGGHASS
jgi:hypothetical protein